MPKAAPSTSGLAAADLIRSLNVPTNTDNLRPVVTRNLDAFVALLKGVIRPGVEKWEEDHLPSES